MEQVCILEHRLSPRYAVVHVFFSMNYRVKVEFMGNGACVESFEFQKNDLILSRNGHRSRPVLELAPSVTPPTLCKNTSSRDIVSHSASPIGKGDMGNVALGADTRCELEDLLHRILAAN